MGNYLVTLELDVDSVGRRVSGDGADVPNRLLQCGLSRPSLGDLFTVGTADVGVGSDAGVHVVHLRGPLL